MSITETATGKPATIASFVVRIEPPSHKATSVDVPPMSKVMTFEKPAAVADRKAPATPPEGPERIVRTGSFAARSAEMLPPEDCITRRLSFLLSDEADVDNRVRYRPIKGWR